MAELSPAAELARSGEWRGWLDELGPDEAIEKLYEWRFWARPEQLAPEGDWQAALWLAGRGFGKTRTGAEYVRSKVEKGEVRRVALVAPTAADARDVMVEGESGIIACCPDTDKPLFEPTKRRVTWRNGAIATLYSADEPERLRGPQHDLAWCFIAGTLIATDRGPVPIEIIGPGTLVLTRKGLRPVLAASATGLRQTGTVEFSDGAKLTGTADHPVGWRGQWIPLGKLRIGDEVCVLSASSGEASDGTATPAPIGSSAALKASEEPIATGCIGQSGRRQTEKSQRATTFTTSIRTPATTVSGIWRVFRAAYIAAFTSLKRRYHQSIGKLDHERRPDAENVARCCRAKCSATRSAPNAYPDKWSTTEKINEIVATAAIHSSPGAVTSVANVVSTWVPAGRAVVFNLQVEEPSEYFANGVLVHNCDEIGSWRYPEAWDMLMFGLRLGANPRVVATTTPRPTKLIRDLLAAKTTVVIRGSTFDNRANLAPSFIDQITRRYQGTRLGRQELSGEVLEDSPGALWSHAMIEDHRAEKMPAELARIVVAVDPAATSGEDADETGIVVVGKDLAGHGWVLADASGRYAPNEWARVALDAYRGWHADRVVAEINNGGEMVEATLRMIDPAVAYQAVRASRGKVTRAEPCAALYEQGRVHHVGVFPQLEDQMCLAGGTLIETHRGQVPIEEVEVDDFVMTRAGYRQVRIASATGYASTFVIIATTDGKELRCTQTHPIFDATAGRFVPARNVRAGMRLNVSPRWASTALRSRGAADGITGCRAAITAMQGALCCTGRFGKRITARSLRGFICTMWTKTQAIISSSICVFCLQPSTSPSTSPAAFGFWTHRPGHSMRAKSGSAASGQSFGACNAGKLARRLMRAAVNFATMPAVASLARNGESSRSDAKDAVPGLWRKTRGASIAVKRVTTLHTAAEKVYNLEVDGEPEYYANGLLVHNCIFARDFDRQRAGFSPDRVDALVWGLSDLLVEPMAGEGIYEIYRQAAAAAEKEAA